MKAIVSEKGQVTIPKALRDKIGLRSGSVLDFSAEDGRLIACKRVEGGSLGKWRGRGKLPVGQTVDTYLGRVRDANGS